MITADTSVLVSGFVVTHEFHEDVQPYLARVLRDGQLISHTIAEAYSVLSSPSGVFRAEPKAVFRYLTQFTQARGAIDMPADSYLEAIQLLASEGRGGGAIFDAVIALSARSAEATLVTIDRRALPIYELCGVDFHLIDALSSGE